MEDEIKGNKTSHTARIDDTILLSGQRTVHCHVHVDANLSLGALQIVLRCGDRGLGVRQSLLHYFDVEVFDLFATRVSALRSAG